jgi:hypothetical protein
VGFVVNRVALGQVFSEYVGFPCQFSFHLLLHNHYRLWSGAATVVQIAAEVSSGFSLTAPQEIKRKENVSPRLPQSFQVNFGIVSLPGFRLLLLFSRSFPIYHSVVILPFGAM